MNTRSKIRVLLSFIILGLSMVLFVTYYMDSTAMAKPVSTPDLVQPTPAPTAVAEAAATTPPTSTPTPTPTPVPEPELSWSLVLVNFENKLPEEYEFMPAFYDTESMDQRIYGSLTAMLKEAKGEGLSLWLASCFRDVETQRKILAGAIENRMIDYGMTEAEAEADALKTIAEPGYSEHHTGLAVDFNTVSAGFEDTAEYRWLKENAADFGFVQRYPKGKEEITRIDVEPWHYRYVGVEHAKEMDKLGLCLEEYIDYLKTK